MTSATRQRWWAAGLLVVGLLVGGAVGALAGSTTAEPEAIAPTTTSTTTTTTVPVLTEYPTAEPAEIELPTIIKLGQGPDPLLAIGMGNQEVIVRATEEGPELLPVAAPGWVMGLGHSLAAYWDGLWLYLAPLDGGPMTRHRTSGRPQNSGEVLGVVIDTGAGRAFAQFDLDEPGADLASTVDIPESIPHIFFDVVDSDDSGAVLRTGGANAYEFFYVGIDGTVLELTEALVLAPEAIAVPGSETGWVDRNTGEPTEIPTPELDSCWPYAFQGDASMWWCDGGLVLWSEQSELFPNARDAALFDDGDTALLVNPQESLTIRRAASDLEVTLTHDSLLISAVRP